MVISTKSRTKEPETMDDFSLEGEELRSALDKIAGINRLLGGNKLTLNGVKELIEGVDKSREITIVDIGCGNGDMLRMLAEYAVTANLKLNLIGIDANQFTIDYAKKLSADFNNISYTCIDIFTPEFETMRYDIALCTLTLHHFSDEEILQIMATFNRNAA
ncbi:MAG: methyltransferase domain-containing protein, partial [Flavobacterium sp.]